MNYIPNKIYIDGLFYKGAGIGRYYESLLKGLAEKGMKIYTCVPAEFRKDFEQNFKQYSKNTIPIYVNYKKFSVKGFWEQGKILKNLEKEISVFHFPHINLPFYVPKNLVVTIHDLCPFTKFWDRSYFKRKIFEWHFKRTIKKAKKIITISESSKEEIANVCPACDAKVKVIYEFVDEKFLRIKDCHNKERLIKDEYILFVGNRKKHKNLGNLIEAFKIIKKTHSELKLVIAGNKFTEIDEVDILKRKLRLKNEILEFMSPSDEEIISLYTNAKTFVLPSFYEGFGLPPLEAMALGVPVVVSDIPVLREVCGDAALFVDSHNKEDIAEGILKVLENNQLKIALIQKGLKRVKVFNREKIIQEYINLYQEILNEKL